jgi:hypothetical protein
MPFELRDKYPAFQVIEGEFAYHTFRHGEIYDTVPPEHEDKFHDISSAGEKGLPSEALAQEGGNE